MQLAFFENLLYFPGKTLGEGQNKCKSNAARTQGYKLLLKLIKALRPKELCNFLEQYLWPVIEDIPAPKKWRHEPSVKIRAVSSEKSGSWSGLNNLSMICYMISML